MKKPKIILSIITTSCLLISQVIPAKAVYIPEKMNDQIVMATQLLEEVLNDNYNTKIEEVKNKTYEDGYDWTLTEEALGEKGNIFSDVDYIELVAAYLTVSDNNISICDIDFFETTYEECSIIEKKAYKYYNYKDNGNGTYKKGSAAYLTEDGYVDVYTENEDGSFSPSGKEYVKLDETEVKYYNPTIRLLSADELRSKYGNEDSDGEQEYNSRLEMLKSSGVSARGLRESIMLNLCSDITLSDEEQLALETALSVEDENRVALIKTASTLLGRIPYQWGGKSRKVGYDDTWWTFDESGEQKGLDCSGFVQWTYRTAGFTDYGSLVSTGSILSNCETISESELMPGDIGVLNNGETTNHTGIYLGNGYWIHCTSSKNTVAITKFPFKIYKRVIGLDSHTLTPYEYAPEETNKYSEEEILLLSKFVSTKAAGDGLNGWIELTQVVLNRVNSPSYPNSISEVINQLGGAQEGEVPENIVSTVKAAMNGRVSVIEDTQCFDYNFTTVEE